MGMHVCVSVLVMRLSCDCHVTNFLLLCRMDGTPELEMVFSKFDEMMNLIGE